MYLVFLYYILDNFFFEESAKSVSNRRRRSFHSVFLALRSRDEYYGRKLWENGNVGEDWLDKYNETLFYRFFRMKKSTFDQLLLELIHRDVHELIRKKYRGGNYPIQPEKSLLIFLWFMANQDTLQCIGHSFQVTASTVMQIVNVFLYVVLSMKRKFIFWPKTHDELEAVANDFVRYPNTLGAIDGSHINIKVPTAQHDSYVDRFLGHSINLMGICTAQKVFSYIFVGFPGSAHDSRVFSYSSLARNIETFGLEYYFPSPEYHIIGDSAFPLKMWLMTPYRRHENMNRIEKHHNYLLSSDRVAVENIFGIVKGRWRRLIFINTYSVAKAVEIATAACILHNFCYLFQDVWDNPYLEDRPVDHVRVRGNNFEENRRAQQKRNNIARNLFIDI